MRTRQNVRQQESSTEILASTPESPSLSAPMLSAAPRAVLEQAEAQRSSSIRELAYRLYEDRGRVDGRDLEDWLEAEAIFQQEGRLVA